MVEVRFKHSSVVYRAASSDWEVFVQGRGWTFVSQLCVGDRVRHLEVIEVVLR